MPLATFNRPDACVVKIQLSGDAPLIDWEYFRIDPNVVIEDYFKVFTYNVIITIITFYSYIHDVRIHREFQVSISKLRRYIPW